MPRAVVGRGLWTRGCARSVPPAARLRVADRVDRERRSWSVRRDVGHVGDPAAPSRRRTASGDLQAVATRPISVQQRLTHREADRQPRLSVCSRRRGTAANIVACGEHAVGAAGPIGTRPSTSGLVGPCPPAPSGTPGGDDVRAQPLMLPFAWSADDRRSPGRPRATPELIGRPGRRVGEGRIGTCVRRWVGHGYCGAVRRFRSALCGSVGVGTHDVLVAGRRRRRCGRARRSRARPPLSEVAVLP